MKKVFYLYPDSSARKMVFQKRGRYAQEFYLLYGKDSASQYGLEALDDFDLGEKIEKSILGKILNLGINQILEKLGFLGGDWYKVWKLRQKIKKADIVFSTADRGGIPLVILRYLKLIPRCKILYTSIGLSEKLKKIPPFARKFYQRVFTKTVPKIICFGYQESLELAKIFGEKQVQFIPFGVDINYFQPQSPKKREGDYILSLGADPRRDFALLLKVGTYFNHKILLITTQTRIKELQKKFRVFPPHISVLLDVPFKQIKDFIGQALFIFLPIKENSYSGATTTLLQSLAMAKAVIVSKTGAISEGYYLENNKNCLLIEPENIREAEKAIKNLLRNPKKRKFLEKNARETVERYLSWDKFIRTLFSLIKDL